MAKKPTYETVSGAINDLIKRGYTTDFYIEATKDCIVCRKSELALSADEFKIDEVHRFEGETDPGDSMIVYAISSNTHDVKGVLMNAYGVYADGTTSAIVAHLEKQLKK
ncbi:phosphoribosylpyrophosphate synthetase [Brumimicrobium salinarum]|uniref:Phosphoribosylpyrophosphate synthetase n=1 Tax=Brumimicrobium salinarum TaxID=2058658 RepID=A0A2I0R3F5_9FLAO|nr:phosphoribosylpyrophosphate synthetase [Brumimicrobium salinarum]PKR81102.1 phosphoribosylpyrophosphate synthetase [Brumimicrobium salinarum]